MIREKKKEIKNTVIIVITIIIVTVNTAAVTKKPVAAVVEAGNVNIVTIVITIVNIIEDILLDRLVPATIVVILDRPSPLPLPLLRLLLVHRHPFAPIIRFPLPIIQNVHHDGNIHHPRNH